jgi:tRNA pseudouridine32 synthase / 23S rRNA pseudouridine746 synthase
MLEPIADLRDDIPTYWYQGYCPHRGTLLRLPRTDRVEHIARELMAELSLEERYSREGKMYGVLLVETDTGDRHSIKAFSGLLNGEAVVAGWVPPIPGRERVAISEAETLADLEQMKQELIALDRIPERERYRLLAAEFVERLEQLSIEHHQRKAARHQQRAGFEATLHDPALAEAIDRLAAQSRQDGRERRQLKQERDEILQPLQELLAQTDDRIRALKQQRKMRSRELQTQMHDAYRLMNFLGTSSSLRELMPAGIPTGTGDCCAPKLLHYAATHRLKPVAMAEFWWGAAAEADATRTASLGNQIKVHGEFYGACLERCQPLMGFMLAGLAPQPANLDLAIIYEDEYLVAVDKPRGLLSVPGRSIDLQDSVLTRLQELYPNLSAVHRLDRDTSGILLFARDRQTYRQLSQQFENRQIHKIYEAILGGKIKIERGSIDLPLWGDPLDRPRQQVDFNLGKPSLTEFQVLGQIDGYTRIEFMPVTGRSHQLRVHAADVRGLGVCILGDGLYGCQMPGSRLHLHARELSFIHPKTSQKILIQSQCPF